MEIDEQYQKIIIKIADNIKRFRKEKALTQEQMIEHGFNYRHFQKLESGFHSPSLYTLHRLSKIFKVKIIDFFK